ncbi:MAG TPA: ATP-binding protein, partial [Thermoanaerobaculia bacterium]|nr:ATP-binding protein [Thermoanaerobaculia bacterium]
SRPRCFGRALLWPYTFFMVSLAHAPLTRIGFRRDVKLFLICLVGFLVILIFSLLLLLRTDLTRTEDTVDWSRVVIADIAADAINHTRKDSGSLQAQLAFLRGRFNIAAAELDLRDGRRVLSGARSGAFDEVVRLTGIGTLKLRFDAAERHDAQRRFWIISIISIAATSFGAMLLLLYLPRITKPIEQMLGDAKEQLGERTGDQEETAYLIQTFRSSIATLKSQEEELKRLHDREKTRADELERVTAALTRSLTSGLIAIDARGLIVDINAAGREILGITDKDSLAGRQLRDVVRLPAFAGALQQAFEQQAPMTRVEIEDQEVTIGLTTVPLRNEAGEFLGFLALFTDLTPIRSLEARVQEMTTLAQLGEISAGIAHEFRSSLSTILGYMKLARRGEIDNVAEGRLQSAEKEASLLLQAIERLLAFARPVQLNAESVDLRGLIEEQVQQLHDIAPEVAFDVNGPPVAIEGDRVLLSRAVENVLRNAVDSIRQKGDGGSVHVTLTDGPTPSVTIVDDGIGFDPAETSRLFLPFHSNKPNGFGMGLPLAKKIVLLHGGTLRLQGEPGKGAVATMEFGSEVPAPAV